MSNSIQANNEPQKVGSQFHTATPTNPQPRLQEMHQDLQDALAGHNRTKNRVDCPKPVTSVYSVVRPLDTKLAAAKGDVRYKAETRGHPETNEAIRRWLAETPKEKSWDIVGEVVKEQEVGDSEESKKSSSRGGNGWSDGTQLGGSEVRSHR